MLNISAWPLQTYGETRLSFSPPPQQKPGTPSEHFAVK